MGTCNCQFIGMLEASLSRTFTPGSKNVAELSFPIVKRCGTV